MKGNAHGKRIDPAIPTIFEAFTDLPLTPQQALDALLAALQHLPRYDATQCTDAAGFHGTISEATDGCYVLVSDVARLVEAAKLSIAVKG